MKSHWCLFCVIRRVSQRATPEPYPAWRTLSHAIGHAPLEWRYEAGTKQRSTHDGQRKLLLSELEFISRHLPDTEGDVVVVYAGAAPGVHILELLAEFPARVKFALYDRTPFVRSLVASERLWLCSRFFDDTEASRWARSELPVFFVSDIRTALPDRSTHTTEQGKQEDDERVECGVARDMEDQARWTLLMQPRAALLKFRPPYWYPWNSSGGGMWSYLPGTVQLPIYGPRNTTECRLDVDVAASLRGDRSWLDPRRHQDVMAFFNAIMRPAYDTHAEDHVFNYTVYCKRHEVTGPHYIRIPQET